MPLLDAAPQEVGTDASSAFCILTLGWSWQGVYGRLRKKAIWFR